MIGPRSLLGGGRAAPQNRFGWLWILARLLPDRADPAQDSQRRRAVPARVCVRTPCLKPAARFAAGWALCGLALLTGCTTLLPGPAGTGAPALHWEAVAPGVELARAAPWPDSVVHVVRVDLRAPALRVAVTPAAERGTTLDGMPSAAGAIVAVNASFFDLRFDARGWTVSDGQPWPQPFAVAASPLLACDRLQRCRIHFDVPAAPAADWFSVVAGTPWLVRAGRARTDDDDAGCANLCAREHPRTAVGLDAPRHRLWIVLAEGRRPPVAGVRLAPLAQWMCSLGVHDAVNLDGGGSSALFVNGRAAMARPANEPAQRRVANGLLVLPVTAP